MANLSKPQCEYKDKIFTNPPCPCCRKFNAYHEQEINKWKQETKKWMNEAVKEEDKNKVLKDQIDDLHKILELNGIKYIASTTAYAEP